MKYLKLFGVNLRLAVLEAMAYRWNFLIKSFSMVIYGIWAPLVAIIVYGVTKGLPGWTLPQLLMLQGLSAIIIGINSLLFFDFVMNVLQKVRDGTFDATLVRPASPLLFESVSAIKLDFIANIITGIVVFTFGFIKSESTITAFGVMSFVVLLFLGLIFMYATNVLIAAIGFIVIKADSLSRLLENLYNFSEYPISIFGPAGLFVFTFVFPIGLASFYPAQALFGLLAPSKVLMLAVIAFAFFGVSLLAWNAGMKKYQSAGG